MPKSHTAVFLEDQTDAIGKIFSQYNEIACDSSKEFLGSASIWDAAIEEKG
jgi:hypothetical protein